MKNFIKISNEGYGEEMELYEVYEDNSMQSVLHGDAYHDKIDHKIDGFMEALSYLDIEYNVVAKWYGYIENGLDGCEVKFDGKTISITSSSCEVEKY